jgi:hypothetical protein
MRVFLALLLCFIVAFQGSVGAHDLPVLCSMDHDGGPWASVDEAAQAVGDCCNDAETAAKTGKLCKTDTPCGSSNGYVLASFHTCVSSAQAADPLPTLTAVIAKFDPSGIWRPPSLS